MKESDKAVILKLKKITIISLIFMTIEIVGGALAHSIAIMADAFHLFSDVIAYIISLYAVLLGTKLAPKFLTFGYEKAQPLGALINVGIIWAVTIQLFIQATNRIISREVVQQPLYMLLTSIFGLGCNLFIMKILHSSQGPGCGHGHHGHSHGHSHDHSHKHQNNHQHKNSCNSNHNDHSHEGHDHHDHDDHSSCSKQKQDHHYKQFVESICSCSSPNQMLKQNDKRFTKSSEKEVDTPFELGIDLVPKSKHQGYCVIHENKQPSHGHGHDNGHGHGGMFQNINIQAAYIHILSDIILSVGVIVSASIIYFVAGDDKEWTYWQLADPFCTYLFSIVALYSTISIIKQSMLLLMDGIENPDLIDKTQYFIKILTEKHRRLEIENFKLWSTNRGKHYFAIRGHLTKLSISNSENTEMLSKGYSQHELIHNKIHAFCVQKKLECYIDIHG